MRVNDSSYPVGGNFGTEGIQGSDPAQAAASQVAGQVGGSQIAGGDDLLELLKKMLMQAEQQGSQGQGSQAGNGGGGGQIQF
jgi:hypothetical protein